MLRVWRGRRKKRAHNASFLLIKALYFNGT
jgi:hypothetical protein